MKKKLLSVISGILISTIAVLGLTATVQWNPNPETDISHYIIKARVSDPLSGAVFLQFYTNFGRLNTNLVITNLPAGMWNLEGVAVNTAGFASEPAIATNALGSTNISIPTKMQQFRIHFNPPTNFFSQVKVGLEESTNLVNWTTKTNLGEYTVLMPHDAAYLRSFLTFNN